MRPPELRSGQRNKRRAKLLSDSEKKQFLAIFEQYVRPYVSTVLIVPRPDALPGEVCSSATGLLLDTGQRRLLNTNAHVHDGYLCCVSKSKNATFLVGGNDRSIPISEPKVVEKGDPKHVDLVSIEVPEAVDLGTIGNTALRPEYWPPERAKGEEVCIGLGFPAKWRRPADTDKLLKVGMLPLILPVASTSDHGFSIAADRADALTVEFTLELTLEDVIGGMSGSPVFVASGAKACLAGFIYEGWQPGNAMILQAAHADFLKADGTLDHSKMPW